jgi:hypothetical protein
MQGKPYPNQVLLKLHAMALTQKIEMKHPTPPSVAALKRDEYPKAFPEHRKSQVFTKGFCLKSRF